MAHAHHYKATLEWIGASAGATTSYQTYSREYRVDLPGKTSFHGSADPTFRGDPALPNPEDLLVVSLSSCHMLSYLALCARAKLPVIAYIDAATGTMDMKDGKIRFVEVVLHPRVTIAAGADIDLARRLHEKAHGECFIANSVNFPVRNEAVVTTAA
ncbi:MAG: OsmC family protein [Alphaproteobacteria bacterium]|nr:OsmC family protein [Alphaproteobacteria bacterium]